MAAQRQGGMYRAHFARAPPQPQRPPTAAQRQTAQLHALLQFVPLLLLLVVTLFSGRATPVRPWGGGGGRGPQHHPLLLLLLLQVLGLGARPPGALTTRRRSQVYSLQQSREFASQLATAAYSVPYYVKDTREFQTKYSPGSRER